MKRLITDVFKIAYKVTRAKTFSLVFALVFITALNFIVIYGLTTLFDEWVSTRTIHKLFTFPYYFVTLFVLLLINFLVMIPSKKLGPVLKNKSGSTPPVLIYAMIALILFLYIYCI